jgi:hypothetical protein
MSMLKTDFKDIMERANEIQAILDNATKYSVLSIEQRSDLLKEAKEIATKLEAYQETIDDPNVALDHQIKESFFSVAKLIQSYQTEHRKFFALLEKRFGTNYEDHDMDQWIDILDYGMFRKEELTVELFRKFMKDMQEVTEKTGEGVVQLTKKEKF